MVFRLYPCVHAYTPHVFAMDLQCAISRELNFTTSPKWVTKAEHISALALALALDDVPEKSQSRDRK